MTYIIRSGNSFSRSLLVLCKRSCLPFCLKKNEPFVKATCAICLAAQYLRRWISLWNNLIFASVIVIIDKHIFNTRAAYARHSTTFGRKISNFRLRFYLIYELDFRLNKIVILAVSKRRPETTNFWFVRTKRFNWNANTLETMWYNSGQQGWGSKVMGRNTAVVDAEPPPTSPVKPSAGRIIRIVNNMDTSVQVQLRNKFLFGYRPSERIEIMPL